MRVRCMAVLFATGLLFAVVACSDGEDPKAVNETCQTNEDCLDGLCHAQICASPAPKDNGQACAGNGDCKSFNCASGKCTAGAVIKDKECLKNEECASNNCVANKCTVKSDGAACASDAECSSTICYAKKCVKSCTKAADCAKGQVCNSDDGKRLLCITPKYNSDVGKSCAVSGSCASGLTCIGTKNDPGTVCSSECKGDLDCPPAFTCVTGADKKKQCIKRRFCSPCLYDGQCGTGKCATFGGGKHCTRECTKGSTECPVYAECKDTGGGKYHCVHKAGKCKGTGKLCEPCTKNADCNTGGRCLTFNMSQESFCGTDCTQSKSCPSGNKCYQVTQAGDYQCGPTGATTTDYPKCVKSLTPMMKPGDIMDDYAAVGYRDSDGDNDLTDEKLKILKFSDLSDKKIILFNISAFW